MEAPYAYSVLWLVMDSKRSGVGRVATMAVCDRNMKLDSELKLFSFFNLRWLS